MSDEKGVSSSAKWAAIATISAALFSAIATITVGYWEHNKKEEDDKKPSNVSKEEVKNSPNKNDETPSPSPSIPAAQKLTPINPQNSQTTGLVQENAVLKKDGGKAFPEEPPPEISPRPLPIVPKLSPIPIVPRSGGNEIKFYNRCRYPIRIALRYREPSNTWVTRGWWNVDANKKTFPTSSNQRLRSNNSVFYYYAEITQPPHKGYKWTGDEKREFRGETLPMRKKNLSLNSEKNYLLSITCTNL